MKVWVEAGYCVDLTDGHIDLSRELLQLIGRQVAKLLLDRPELIKQGAEFPLVSDERS
jgi:hypothetical protein